MKHALALVLTLVLATSASTATAKRALPAVKRTATARPATRPDAAAPTPHAASAPRTLEDIHIEGEIPVPQVLFITARDQRRFVDFKHHRYLRTSREVGARAARPSRVAFPGAVPVETGKETPR